MDRRKIGLGRFYGSIYATAELVVPRSIPTFMRQARSRTLNSSFQRRPSAATHHNSSIPVSVTLLSSVTGTI